MTRTPVPYRVHGPFQHRQRWRVEVWEHDKRTGRHSFATYGEALLAATGWARGVETPVETPSTGRG